MPKANTYRLPDELETKLNKMAADVGTPKNKIITYAVGLYTQLDIDFIKDLNGLAVNLKMGPGEIIQRRMSAWFGRLDAHVELFGTYGGYEEDLKTSGDYKKDLELHDQEALFELEKEIVKNGLQLEAQGIEKLPREYMTAIMVKHRVGKAWENSEEKKRADALKAEIDPILGERTEVNDND